MPQRYTPEELDDIADQLRDEAIRHAEIYLPGNPNQLTADHLAVCSTVDTRVALARLLRDDAARLRRNAAMMQRRD